MSEQKLHYFNDVYLKGKESNIISRKEMLKGFNKIEDLEVAINYLISRKDDKIGISNLIETRIDLKPLYTPEIFRKTSNKRFIRLYNILIQNRLINIFYMLRLLQVPKDDKVYIWGLQSAFSLYLLGSLSPNKVILELDDHVFGKDRLKDHIYLKAAEKSSKVSTVSYATYQDLISRGIKEEKIDILPNAVDYKNFHMPGDKDDIREKLSLDKEKFLVIYTGQLYDWKGIPTLLKAFHKIDAEDTQLIIVGGREDDIERYRNYTKSEDYQGDVRFEGYVSRDKIPLYQNTADLLVLPNTARSEKSREYTSPLKLKEYLAANTPLIVSELPSIKREVSSEEVFYFNPDNPAHLAEKMLYIRKNWDKAERKLSNSIKRAENYTWEDRARKLIDI
jgi:glycosyltransferase involved in cell wall biosynthesis